MFDVGASAYDAFMGRWSRLLADPFADFAGVLPGWRVLDVGAGTGALTAELLSRSAARNVAAADPSTSFVLALRQRFPGIDVEEAPAESLPFPADAFDAALAQLVVSFMHDPVAGVHEMARVVKAGGVVAACVWDFERKRDPLRHYWAAARELDPALVDESNMPGTGEGQLAELFGRAGLVRVEQTTLTIELEFATFEDWWAPFESGVGPAGVHFASLSEADQARVRASARRHFGEAPNRMSASAWAARGMVAS